MVRRETLRRHPTVGHETKGLLPFGMKLSLEQFHEEWIREHGGELDVRFFTRGKGYEELGDHFSEDDPEKARQCYEEAALCYLPLSPDCARVEAKLAALSGWQTTFGWEIPSEGFSSTTAP